MMEFNIRLLTTQDAMVYNELRLKSFVESPFAFSESFEDESKKATSEIISEVQAIGDPPEYFLLGAFNTAEQLIGFVKFKRDQRTKARHKSMIHAMYVDPFYRNKKIGQALVADVITRARKLIGLEQIHL